MIVPGGCSKYVQVPGVSWNITFKANCTEPNDDWLATEGINNKTKVDNLEAPQRKEFIK